MTHLGCRCCTEFGQSGTGGFVGVGGSTHANTKSSCACDCGRGPVSVGAFFFLLLLLLLLLSSSSFFFFLSSFFLLLSSFQGVLSQALPGLQSAARSLTSQWLRQRPDGCRLNAGVAFSAGDQGASSGTSRAATASKSSLTTSLRTGQSFPFLKSWRRSLKLPQFHMYATSPRPLAR